VQKKVAKVGFDWQSEKQIIDKIEEELAEVKSAMAAGEKPDRIDEEIGDLIENLNIRLFRKYQQMKENK
jgi:ATP diphosphatase